MECCNVHTSNETSVDKESVLKSGYPTEATVLLPLTRLFSGVAVFSHLSGARLSSEHSGSLQVSLLVTSLQVSLLALITVSIFYLAIRKCIATGFS